MKEKISPPKTAEPERRRQWTRGLLAKTRYAYGPQVLCHKHIKSILLL